MTMKAQDELYPLGDGHRDMRYGRGPGLQPWRPRVQVRDGTEYIAAQWTGSKRRPLTGEWYISGAVPHAYRALADLTTEYYIARIVKFRVKVIVKEVTVINEL